MKKFNFIIGKRQIMISTLILILGVAAYLNWLAAGDKTVSVMDVMNPKKTVTLSAPDETDEGNFGEAELVSAEENKGDTITKAKLQKTRARAETQQALHEQATNPENTEETRNKAAEAEKKLVERSEKETNIEEQVKQQPTISDCITYIETTEDENNNKNGTERSKTNVSVAVKTNEKMTQDKAAQILNIAKNTVTDLKPHNFSLTAIDATENTR